MEPPSCPDVKRRLRKALTLLQKRDEYLLTIDANERSITHRLGMYLQEMFKDWDVDCEYNRIAHDGEIEPKRLALDANDFCLGDVNEAITDKQGRTVFPDIIVHHRGCRDNLLVIEVKKAASLVSDKVDRRKLKRFKEDRKFGYRYAAFVKIRTGNDSAKDPSISWL